MILRIDGHVHLHGCFDLLAALRHLASRLGGDGARGVALVTERAGERLLADWREGAFPAGLRAEVCGDGVSMQVRVGQSDPVLLVPGRQVVTSDGLEVLALCADVSVPSERMSLAGTLEWADAEGALVVVPWGLGKWTGARGALLRRVLEQSGPGSLLLGDSTMRPDHCPGEHILAWAAAEGFQILPGSDALPVVGEEVWCGSYYGEIEHGGALTDPVRELRELLGRCVPLACGGGRPGWGRVLRRQMRYECARRLGR